VRFGERALVYDRWAIPQRRSADWTAEWIESKALGLRALEFGAGTGLFTQHLEGRGFDEIVAVEMSIRMAAEGRRRFPQFHWIEANAWDPPRISADRIYSCSVLQWVDDPLAVLRRWRERLSPQGRLLCGVYVHGSMASFQSIDSGFAALRWRDSETWRSAFTDVGFSVSRAAEREDADVFPNACDALRSIHRVGAVGERRKSVGELRDFLDACDKRFPEGFPVEWRSLRIECVAD